ncbi:MAG: beta-galactosidase [Candidatus Gallimonas sp.]
MFILIRFFFCYCYDITSWINSPFGRSEQEEDMSGLSYSGRKFYKDGKEYRIFSGAIHYFRVTPSSWKDRLIKLKNCGFNTVETYVCWSLHEREEGKFVFSGALDLGAFLDLAKEVGLNAIVRPGPYICAETDFGGLPSWLLCYPDLELRCDNAVFLEKTERYFRALSSVLVPRLEKNGGNVVMMQVENEYGSYGNDEEYKRKLLALFRDCGFDCLLFTADGAEPMMLKNGSIEGVMKALTFGSSPEKNMKILEDVTDQPLFCAEYWNGWFDVWGKNHYVRSADEVGAELRQFLDLDASFNFYMFCGGTNFGMINGANFSADKKYWFQTTSYDYNAPLNEAGDLTDKYFRIKEIMEEYTGEKYSLPVENSKKRAYPSLTAREYAPLLSNLDASTCVKSAYPVTFEKLGVDFGYALYTTYTDTTEEGELWIRGLRDRATVLVNGKIRGVQEHGEERTGIRLTRADGVARIDILVENRGRCNYSWQLSDPKGILSGVVFCGKFLLDFENYPLRADAPRNLRYLPADGGAADAPAYFRFILETDDPADTYLSPAGFRNGCAFVNGVNIGRYNNLQSPQKTLYLPAGLLKKGKNEIVLFETDGTDDPVIAFFEAPVYRDAENDAEAQKTTV